jgi:hypothetical protein
VRATTTVITRTAISDPGIFLLILGQKIKIARAATPTMTAMGFNVEIDFTIASIFSGASMVFVPGATLNFKPILSKKHSAITP